MASYTREGYATTLDLMLALVVSLKILPGQRERFLAAAEDDATSSVRDEEGCLRFDVLHDEDDENHFIFYEVYRDEAAFQAHQAAPHFQRWQAARDVTVESSSRFRCSLEFPRAYTAQNS
jgi:autoinducer 2-degrading protein